MMSRSRWLHNSLVLGSWSDEPRSHAGVISSLFAVTSLESCQNGAAKVWSLIKSQQPPKASGWFKMPNTPPNDCPLPFLPHYYNRWHLSHINYCGQEQRAALWSHGGGWAGSQSAGSHSLRDCGMTRGADARGVLEDKFPNPFWQQWKSAKEGDKNKTTVWGSETFWSLFFSCNPETTHGKCALEVWSGVWPC